MRSVVALAALALSGTLDLAAASHCKPRPSHISSATTDLTPSDTATSAAASETAGSVVIKSVVDGGGFSIAPPEGGIPGFTAEGDATIVVGPGYKGDGSKDSGCLSLQASGDKKRDLGSFAGVAQSLELLSLTRPYTVRFFYFVVTAPSLNFCQLTASLGSQTFFQTWIISFGTSVQWGMALEQVTAAQRSAPLSISMNCLVGGSAQVYVDSLFMSNQVTPATIDDHPLDLGDGDVSDFTTTSSPAVQTTTSSQVGTTSLPPIIPTHTQSSDSYSNSATPGTGSPNTQSAGNHTPVTGSPHTVPTGNNTPGPVDSQTSAGGNTQATSQPGPQTPGSQTPGAQTPGARTTTSSSEKQTSTESAATSATTSGGSSSPRQSSTIKPDGPVSRVCANVGTSSIEGRGCGMQPYNSAGAYSRFTSSNYQKEDCAALCLADENCKSFEWSYGNNCANECRLIASVLSDVPVGNTGTQFTSYDRSCIISKPCPSFPEDSICINKMGDTPNKGCVRRKGTLKSCAQEFAALTVQPCGGGDQCRDMCAMYADCQSYSYTSLLSQRNCKLYAGTTDEITEEGGSDYFSDVGCWACGQNMGFATYGLLTNDNVVLPEMTCQAPTKAVADTPTTFNTRTTQAAESTSSSSPAIQQPPTTTTESASSTATIMTCPTGIAAPGFCQKLDSLPTQAVSIPGILDHWPQSDNDVEPPVQRTCNAFGVKKGGWWGRGIQENARQTTMEDCALLCREQGYCEAFGLDNTDPNRVSCALSTYKLGTEGIDIDVPYSFWWSDLDCYECHDCQTA
ncbi:uncharacterized protein FFB20_02739 [Fusarium fujikuroi]|uniref:Apple domain-containing protein n=1 Tax=Fusarium fujikuroi TaxID=5127 RepID=A0A9Q9S1N9_FUSFU|nr:hypothetical protein CEK27_010433 [Fusarium fujikuroi]SCN67723.1 uncharacterized protein FFB20_02739 [Fusarium fujikuroi]VTT83752.1 unnamed protein product [Fusarium fujikuroi]